MTRPQVELFSAAPVCKVQHLRRGGPEDGDFGARDTAALISFSLNPLTRVDGCDGIGLHFDDLRVAGTRHLEMVGSLEPGDDLRRQTIILQSKALLRAILRVE